MPYADHSTLEIDAYGARLAGKFAAAATAEGVVVLLLPGDLRCFSPADDRLLDGLRELGLATLVVGLLTPAEAANGDLAVLRRFDIPLLSSRAKRAIVEAGKRAGTQRVGLVAKGTATAAAIVAATRCPQVGAVASVFGRPDLARARLRRLQAPTLLLVGQEDQPCSQLNQRAAAGAVEEAVRRWFETHLLGGQHRRQEPSPPRRPDETDWVSRLALPP